MSDSFELLVVGGGPAGFAAARGYRKAGGSGAVAIVSDEHRMPYKRPPLTKGLLRGETGEQALALEPEHWLAENQVALISGRAATLDPDAHEVVLSGARAIAYGRCVLATGAEPKRLPIPGADDPGVLVVRTLDHVRELVSRLPASGGEVVVIGSGFIGCEIASSLRHRGLRVTLVSDETAPNEARLGTEAAARIADWLQAEGVSLELGAAVSELRRSGQSLQVSVDGSATAAAGTVVMATGVAPRSELLAPTGIALDEGAVPTDQSLRTTLGDVLAAGDVCKAHNAAAGRRLRVEHWGDALAQGEIAGRTAAGVEAGWDQVPGFWSTIGQHTLKYAAWGDGYEQSRFEEGPGGSFAVWYGRAGRIVGVLTHENDTDYERGLELIAEGAPWQ